MSGVAPDAVLGAGGYVELESSRGLAPSARLAAFGAANGAFAGRSASFLIVAGRLDGCPVRLGSRTLSVRPCLAASLGLIRAEGISVADATVADRVWLDLSALARLRWAPGAGRVFLEIDGGLAIPLLRSTFVFESPTVVVHQVPPAGAVASAGAGVRFW
jgi:hypothetical protein